MEPTTMLALAGLASQGLGALVGGGEQEMNPYRGAASAQTTLEDALRAIKGFGANLEQRGPARLRSAVVQPGPAPVQIKGLPFQLGGGLGVDPALRDQSLLSSSFNPGTTFQGLFAGQGGSGAGRGAAPKPKAPDASSLAPEASTLPGVRRKAPTGMAGAGDPASRRGSSY